MEVGFEGKGRNSFKPREACNPREDQRGEKNILFGGRLLIFCDFCKFQENLFPI